MKPTSGFSVVCVAVMGMLFGCSKGVDLREETPWQIKVAYEQRPLADVHVVVHRPLGSQWEAVLEGVTNRDGIAFLQPVPTIDPPQADEWPKFKVTMESYAGGEWMIKPKWTAPGSSDLKIASIEAHKPLAIELPKQAIAPL
jgi:hypothetical protein